MKKILFTVILIMGIAVLIYFLLNQNKEKDLSLLFDEKPNDTVFTCAQTNPADDSEKSQIQPPDNTDKEESTESLQDSENNGEDVSSEENISEVTEEEDTTPDTDKVPFTHSDSEKQTVVNRYIEAEEFYYSMLYQRYELDGYDIITVKNDEGYETEYHRVIYYNVNSKAELKDHYSEYFTSAFVAKTDMSAYIESNGKLYAAITESSAPSAGAKYTYSVESIDSNTAYVVRTYTNGSGAQKIKAIKTDGIWYFDSVAVM